MKYVYGTRRMLALATVRYPYRYGTISGEIKDYSVLTIIPLTIVPYGSPSASLGVLVGSYITQTIANTMHNSKIDSATNAIPFIIEAPNEADAEAIHDVHLMSDIIDEHEVDESLREFIKNEICQVTERARYFEAKIEDKFRVLFEMSKILGKKMAKVLEKIPEVDQKMPSSAGPSAGPMATNHEYV